MKALIVLSNGFEDVEALCTFDILKRSGIELTKVSLDSLNVLSAYGNIVNADVLLKDIDYNDFDFLIIPGGKAVFEVLNKRKEIDDLIDDFYFKNKLIACICAAPLLLGKRGYFEGLEYTCFPGCDELIISGIKSDEAVVSNDKFITAKSMYYTIPFALEIVNRVLGYEKMEKVKRNIMGL